MIKSVTQAISERRASAYVFLILMVAVLLNPLNYPIAAGLRANDLLILSGMILSAPFIYLQKAHLYMFTCFLVVFSGALFSGAVFGSEFRPEGFIFLYKHSLLFILPLLASWAIERESDRQGMVLALFYTFLFLCFWAFYYRFALGGSIAGFARPSFPTSDYSVSDAHMYSSYLAAMISWYFLFASRYLHHGALLTVCILGFATAALLLTGSRNGIVLIALALLVYFSLQKKCLSQKMLQILVVGCVAISGALTISLLYFRAFIDVLFSGVLARALNFYLSDDVSSLNRIVKFEIAIDDLQSSYGLGMGATGTTIDWYDSFVSITLAQLGLAGLILYLLFCAMCLSSIRRRLRLRENRTDFSAATSIFVAYAITNLITEFSLLTRSLLPVVCAIVVIIPVQQKISHGPHRKNALKAEGIAMPRYIESRISH